LVNAVIFIIHFIFIFFVFNTKYKNESISSAFLNFALIIILFSIGWSLSSIIAKWIMEPEGLGKLFDRDTFSLSLVTVIEFFFYRIYYKPDIEKYFKKDKTKK